MRLGETERAEQTLAELGEQDRECGKMPITVAALRLAQDDPRATTAALAPVPDGAIPVFWRTWLGQADLAGPYVRQARGPAHAGRSCRAARHREYTALIPSPTATITSTPSSTLVPASPMRFATSAPRK